MNLRIEFPPFAALVERVAGSVRRAHLVYALVFATSVANPTNGLAQDQDLRDVSFLDSLRRTTDVVQGEGVVIAANAVEVSNAVTSTIAEIHFDAEQFVNVGDLLFSLDAAEFELALAAARAKVSRAKAQLERATSAFERARKLTDTGTASEVVLEEAKAERDVARADLALAEVSSQRAELDLERTLIRAPISGTVGPPLVSVGTFVEAEEGDPLARIVQLDPILVAYEEPYIEQLALLRSEQPVAIDEILQLVSIRLVLGGELEYPLTSKPDRVSSTVDPETGRITLWSEFRNPESILRPGMRVSVLSEIDEVR